MKITEKIIQISARAEGSTSLQALFALTDQGNIYRFCDGDWTRIELPHEQKERRAKEEAEKPAKKGWFG